MLYHLLYPLKELFFAFNLFRYITFRAAFASFTAFILSVVIGPVIIRRLKRTGVIQYVMNEEECPPIYPLHKHKQGIPTMGGILIVLSIVLSTLLWAKLDNPYVLLALFSTAWLGVVGFVDDFIKVKTKSSHGLTKRVKFIGQTILGLIIGSFIFLSPAVAKNLEIPFLKDVIINLGFGYILFATLVIVGSSNAVNLTDGLDGLAIGCVAMVGLTYASLSYVSGNVRISDYLNVSYVPHSGELAVFCSAIIGASLGFLWYNSHPAEVFMGDTGALALGGAIGVVSLFIKKELLLILAGGIFVVEALSVILQVGSFKLRGKRIFKVAPFHHHLQAKGWSESKVTIRLWIVAAILALLSLATLKIR